MDCVQTMASVHISDMTVDSRTTVRTVHLQGLSTDRADTTVGVPYC